MATLDISWKHKYIGGLNLLRKRWYALPVKQAIKSAIENGYIENTPESIALFLLRGSCFGLDKGEVGEYMAE